jgi:hypothetical protein
MNLEPKLFEVGQDNHTRAVITASGYGQQRLVDKRVDWLEVTRDAERGSCHNDLASNKVERFPRGIVQEHGNVALQGV